MNWRHLPNVITGARIALVLPLVGLMRAGDHGAALVVAALAAFTDALDGFLAKRFGWQTPLGALLDPIADKVLLAACFVGLWESQTIAGWLLGLVLGRDVVIVAGALAFHWLIGPVEALPTRLSKLTTVVQIAFVLMALLHLAWRPMPGSWLSVGVILVAGLTLASGLDYVLRWSWRAASARRDAKRDTRS